MADELSLVERYSPEAPPAQEPTLAEKYAPKEPSLAERYAPQPAPEPKWKDTAETVGKVAALGTVAAISGPVVAAVGAAAYVGLPKLAEAVPMVHRLMAPLGYLQRLATNAVVHGAALIGIPGMKELADRSGDTVLGNLVPSDVTDFMIDKTGNPTTDLGQFVKTVVKTGAGLTTNWYADPIRLSEFGQLTEEARQAQIKGSTSPLSQEKNLVSIRAPFGKEPVAAIPMSVVNPAIEQLKRIPGVQMAASLIRQLSPNTGVPDIDQGMAHHAQSNYGNEAGVKMSYLLPEAQKSYSPQERAFIMDLSENTPNIAPRIAPDIIEAAGTKISATEEEVRLAMSEKIEKLAKTHGITLPPGRAEQIMDSTVNVKIHNGMHLEALERAGKLNPENVNDMVRENHMPHVMNPAYEGAIGDRILLDLQKKRMVSSKNFLQHRSMEGTVRDINDFVENMYGKKEFFMEDPFQATALRLVKSMKLEQDAILLNRVSKFGISATSDAGPLAQKLGWKSIDHPEFNEREVMIHKDLEGNETIIPRGQTPVAEGTLTTVKHGELLFPPDVASKVGYYVGAKTRNFGAALGEASKYLSKGIEFNNQLNQINRATVFASEGMMGRNTLNNLVKLISAGGQSRHIFQSIVLLGAKKLNIGGWRPFGEGYWKAPGEPENFLGYNSVTKKPYTGAELRQALVEQGMTSSNSFHDGMGDFLNKAKELTFREVTQSKGALGMKWATQTITNMMHHIVVLGEYGENMTRSALFLKHVEEGYSFQDAGMKVNEQLFDYRRNSPVTDAARFFAPYIQHPIKSALSAPRIVGQNPALWNFTSNTLPKVLANAAMDPVTQDAVNNVLPDYLRMKSPVGLSLLTGNTWLSHFFTNPKVKGQLPALAYINIEDSLGMGILGHWDYFSKAAREGHKISNYGLGSLPGALLNVIQGHDNFGKDLKGTADNLGYLVRQGVLGNVALPNTFKIIKEQFGLVDPGTYEPATLLLMRGLFGQLGGFTDLDRDFHIKTWLLSTAFAKIQKEGMTELRSMAKATGDGKSDWSIYSKSNRDIMPISNHELFIEAKQKMIETQQEFGAQTAQTNAAGDFLAKRTSVEDYVGRLKGLVEETKRLNQNYQFMANRQIEMAKGARNPQEALKQMGMQLTK